MIDPVTTNNWFYRAIYLLIAIVVLFLYLLPLQTTPSSWAAPNILICITFAWVLRRPDYVPVTLIALVMITADFLLMRPPGLLAGLVVVASEVLRSRRQTLREIPFVLEWAMVSGAMLMIVLVARFIQVIVILDRPSFTLVFLELLATIALYPIVVAISRFALGVRAIAHGEVDRTGHHL